MEIPSSHSSSVRFGSYELDLRAGELRNNGQRIRLQDQPLQILAMLLESPGQVVTREELRRRLWPSDTFVDFDHGLNKSINKLREALGDSAETPHFIETLPKRGYRFLVAASGLPAPAGRTFIDSIAVFPLSTSLPDPDLEYLSVGIPGSIIHSLSHIPGLRVIAWNSLSRGQSREEDPLAIGRSVGAKVILIGRIWQRDSKLRLHVDLLDTATGEALWGEQYDRDLTELFTIHDDIAREVSARLRVKLTGEDTTRLTKRYTENVEAYQLYVRARRWCEKRSAEGFKRGMEYLTRAIELDPNFALAHAELAQVISVPCYYGAVDPNLAYPKARASALRALELDPNLPEAHEVLATVLKNYDWNWEAAEKEYIRAIELNSNYSNSHYHYSYFLFESGRSDEAILEATEALSRDPMSGLLNAGLAWVLLNTRHYERCIKQAQTAIEVDPNMVLCRWSLATAFEELGEYEAALEAYEKGFSLGAPLALGKAFVAHLRAREGKSQEAWDILKELEILSKTRFVPEVTFAIIYDGLKEADLACASLERACEKRETNLVQIKAHPHFDAVRHHPRFQAVERRVGLRK
jgi:serine/threonine-protein kinase